MEKTSSAYIPSLDGMRGISILLVYVAHIGYEKIVPGGLGVTIFFFISGYIITNLLLDEYNKTGDINLKLFYFRRLLRLYPPLLLMICLFFSCSVLLNSQVNMSEVPAALLYYENYFFFYHSMDNHSSLMILWSLAVEEHFYLIFPFIFILLFKQPKMLLFTMLLLIFIPLGLRYLEALEHPGDSYVSEAYCYLLTHTRFDSIIYGCIASVVLYISNSSSYEKVLSNKWIFAGALLVQAMCLLVRDPVFRNTIRYSLQGMSLFILIPAIVNIKAFSYVKAFLSNKALVFTGKLSYSIYLMHMLAVNGLMFIKTNGHTVLYLVAVTAVTLILALSSYYLIEMPLGKLRKKLKPKALNPAFVTKTNL